MSWGRLNLRILVFLGVFIICFGGPAHSGVIDEVSRDFKSISGYVIMETEGDYLIDLDASSGISPGDLFSVMQTGKKIVHPKTGKVLGTLEKVKGILKVYRLESEYSFTRVLGEAKAIKRGDAIGRYRDMTAAFWDYTGKGETFFFRLRDALPLLKWQNYSSAQKTRPKTPTLPSEGGPTLVFILKAEGLEVRDPEFQIIHTYGPPELHARPSQPKPVAPEAKTLVTPAEPRAATTLPKVTDEPEKPDLKPEGPVKYEPAFHGYQRIGKLPSVTMMTDFIQVDQEILMAVTDGSEIAVYRVGEELAVVSQGRPTGRGQILALKWWRPSEQSALYLTATTLTDQDLASFIFKVEGEKLVVFKDWIPFILGAFDRDGNGSPETLLRQSFSRKTFWGSQVMEFRLAKGDLSVSEPNFKLPREFTVLGSVFADLTGNSQLESAFVRNGLLYVYNGKEKLYQTPAIMGGSLSVAKYEEDPGASFSTVVTVILEVSPVAVDVDHDGRLELLAVATDSTLVKTPRWGVKKSWLAVIKYKDGEFVKGTLGDELESAVQGLMVDGNRIFFVTSTPGSFFGKGAGSRLLAYPLAQ
jgi:hypothetical protein